MGKRRKLDPNAPNKIMVKVTEIAANTQHPKLPFFVEVPEKENRVFLVTRNKAGDPLYWYVSVNPLGGVKLTKIEDSEVDSYAGWIPPV